jgi:hypothetical protein
MQMKDCLCINYGIVPVTNHASSGANEELFLHQSQVLCWVTNRKKCSFSSLGGSGCCGGKILVQAAFWGNVS